MFYQPQFKQINKMKELIEKLKRAEKKYGLNNVDKLHLILTLEEINYLLQALSQSEGESKEIWLLEDCDGSSVLEAYLTREQAEIERQKLRKNYSPSVDFRIYPINLTPQTK